VRASGRRRFDPLSVGFLGLGQRSGRIGLEPANPGGQHFLDQPGGREFAVHAVIATAQDFLDLAGLDVARRRLRAADDRSRVRQR